VPLKKEVNSAKRLDDFEGEPVERRNDRCFKDRLSQAEEAQRRQER